MYSSLAKTVGLLVILLSAATAVGDDFRLAKSEWIDSGFATEAAAGLEPLNAFRLGRQSEPVRLVGCCGGSTRDGFFADAELGILKVAQSDSNNLATRLMQVRAPGSPPAGSLADGYCAAPRVTLGYLSAADNLGFQIRIWDFDHAESAAFPPAMVGAPNQISHSWEATVLDVEVIRPFCTPLGPAIFSGGYRLAYYKEEAILYAGLVESSSVQSRFPGNGLTGAVNCSYPLWGGLSAMFAPRASLVFGAQKTTPDPASFTIVKTPQNDGFDPRWIAETQLGLTYERPMSGGLWFVRTGYEIQYWNDFVPAIGLQTDSAWTMFHGAFFTVGISR